MAPRAPLASRVATAMSAHPGIHVSTQAFEAWVRARLDQPEAPSDLLHVEDLLIAYGCTLGNDAALAIFEAQFMPAVRRAIEKAGAHDAPGLAQQLASRLLVADDDRPPGIASYRGRGSLKGWLAVCAAREAMMALRKSSPAQAPAAGAALAQAVQSDPELRLMKAQAADAFEEALHDALRDLPDRDRNLLRYQVADGLSGLEIAAIYGAHPSTVSRWLASARETVRCTVRQGISARLDLSSGQVDSLMRLIESRLDVSLGGALAPLGVGAEP